MRSVRPAPWPAAAAYPHRWFVKVMAAASIVSTAAAALTESWWLLVAPAGLFIGWLAVIDYRRLYYLLLATLPLSIEVELPGGLGTDLPSEPLMWVLMGTALFWLARHWHTIDRGFLLHPVTMALLLHLAWMTLSCLFTTLPIVSLKFWLAKGWYVGVFFFLAAHIFQREADVRNFIGWFLAPLLLTVCIVLVRHAAVGFSFAEVNYVMGPFYRNHVVYACIQAVFFPFVWLGIQSYRRLSWPWWILVVGAGLLLVGINFAYARAAYVALLIAIGIYFLVRWRLFLIALLAAAVVLSALVVLVTHRDNWLLFAPNYERTITHKRFDNLLEATTRLEDISIMERVYRWVAAAYMIAERPFLGFGPGTFYFNYKGYTVNRFRTYVSHNPERSGIHNYYLMVAVEQGLPGLAFFLLFFVAVFVWGQRAYHRLRDRGQQRIVMAALLSFSIIGLLLLMNDFVETDKIGSLFFICAALVVNASLREREENCREAHPNV
ncbi:MAG: O-antigen ligase family protein [Saprospiraceae bacterium]|nr:O-antigen ligase family protein [Saprospiraceae bacterium]MDW8485045.1 O-antigen ligase family protein [Saprospiraceae bacterium]